MLDAETGEGEIAAGDLPYGGAELELLSGRRGSKAQPPLPDSGGSSSASVGVRAFVGQVWQHRNLKAFVGMFALQQFDCAFGKNFFPIFLERLVGDTLSPASRSSIVSASFILPWLGTIWLTKFVRAAGLSAAVSMVLTVRVVLLGAVLPALALRLVDFSGWPCAVLLLTNRVVSEAMCRLLPLVQTDLVDEDMCVTSAPAPITCARGCYLFSHSPMGHMRLLLFFSRYLHKRETSMSASIIGTIGLLGKPSQSFAPMAGFALLSGIVSPEVEATGGGTGGGAVSADGGAGGGGGGALKALTGEQRSTVEWTFLLLPMCVVVLQQLLWHGVFSLRGSYLATVKNYIRDTLDVTRSV